MFCRFQSICQIFLMLCSLASSWAGLACDHEVIFDLELGELTSDSSSNLSSEKEGQEDERAIISYGTDASEGSEGSEEPKEPKEPEASERGGELKSIAGIRMRTRSFHVITSPVSPVFSRRERSSSYSSEEEAQAELDARKARDEDIRGIVILPVERGFGSDTVFELRDAEALEGRNYGGTGGTTRVLNFGSPGLRRVKTSRKNLCDLN